MEPYAVQLRTVIAGMYVEMLKAVFTDMGVNYNIRVMPPIRTIHEFLYGTLDVTVSSGNTSGLSAVAYLSKVPLSSHNVMLMGRVNSPLEVMFSALRKNSVTGGVRGFSQKTRFLPNNEVIFVNSREQLLKVLFAGRVDYIMWSSSDQI